MTSTKKDDTRLRLLDVARKLFLTHGFHGVALEDIAEAAGVSRQAVYKSHFSSKADLVLELARHVHVVEKLDELIQPAFDASTGPEKLEATVRTVMSIQNKLHDLALVLSTAARTDAGAKAAWDERMGDQRSGIRGAFVLLKAEGRLNPAWTVEEATDMLAALLSTETYEQLIVERRWKSEALTAHILTLSQAFLVDAPQTRRPGRQAAGPSHKPSKAKR